MFCRLLRLSVSRLGKKIVNGSRTLLDVVNGASAANRNSHEGVIAALRTVRCFECKLAGADDDADAGGAPGAGGGATSRCFHCQSTEHRFAECPNRDRPRVAAPEAPRAPRLTLVVEARHKVTNRRSVVAGLVPVTPTPHERTEMQSNRPYQRGDRARVAAPEPDDALTPEEEAALAEAEAEHVR